MLAARPFEDIPTRKIVISDMPAKRDTKGRMEPCPFGYRIGDARPVAIEFRVCSVWRVEENRGVISAVVIIQAAGPIAVYDANAL